MLLWLDLIYCLSQLDLNFVISGHTQDKQIQRDDEYYEGDNDNDHDMDDAWWCLSSTLKRKTIDDWLTLVESKTCT